MLLARILLLLWLAEINVVDIDVVGWDLSVVVDLFVWVLAVFVDVVSQDF